mmetsp:Transcript_52728/g.125543  ORF Transcript_52728/g.125543 Transcript_52728/m.125543 type:complete len:690 (-) Transcript_52728:71-2140(-)
MAKVISERPSRRRALLVAAVGGTLLLALALVSVQVASTGRTVLVPADSTIAGLERMVATEDSSLESSEGAMGVFPNPQLAARSSRGRASLAGRAALIHGQKLQTAGSAAEEEARVPAVISSPGEQRLSNMLNAATRSLKRDKRIVTRLLTTAPKEKAAAVKAQHQQDTVVLKSMSKSLAARLAESSVALSKDDVIIKRLKAKRAAQRTRAQQAEAQKAAIQKIASGVESTVGTLTQAITAEKAKEKEAVAMAKTAAELARTHDFKWSQKAQVEAKNEEAKMEAMLLKMRADKETANNERTQEDGMRKMLQKMSSLSHAAPLTPPPAAAVSNNDVADAPEPESPPVATRAAPAGKARRVFTKAAEVVPEKNEINLGGGVEGSGLGDFGDTEARVAPSDDVFAPVETAAATWRTNSNPLAAAFLGDAKLTGTPLFAQGIRAPKDIQKAMIAGADSNLLQFAHEDNMMGNRSPLLNSSLQLMFGNSQGMFLDDKYGYPSDTFPSPKQLHAQRNPKARRALQGGMEFPAASKLVAVLKRRCSSYGCHFHEVLQHRDAPCDLPLCSPVVSTVVDTRARPKRVKQCTPLGCSYINSPVTAAKQDSLKQQIEQGAVGGLADPFGFANSFSDTRAKAPGVVQWRNQHHYGGRSQAGEPISDLLVRGWNGHNAVSQVDVTGQFDHKEVVPGPAGPSAK